MTNEQNIQTKKWNKLSVGVFVLTVGICVLTYLKFGSTGESKGLYFYDVIRFFGGFQFFWIINSLLFIFSIFSLIQAKKRNQKGSVLSLISLGPILLLSFLSWNIFVDLNRPLMDDNETIRILNETMQPKP